MLSPNYVSLSQMTMSESTDYDYTLNLSGYQMKLILWGLSYLENEPTGIPQLDLPKSQWGNLKCDLTKQIDGAGTEIEPDPRSSNHLDVMAQIQE